MAWMRSGTTTFITPCTPCSPGKRRLLPGLRRAGAFGESLSRKASSTPASIRPIATAPPRQLLRGPSAGRQFVVFSQNHDQVGNRMLGDRLTTLVSFEQLKLAAGAVLLSPFLPLLFMGEEYGETRAVPVLRQPRRPGPDRSRARAAGRRNLPLSPGRANRPIRRARRPSCSSKLNPDLRDRAGRHRCLFEFYRELIRLRRALPALAQLSKEHMEVACLKRNAVLCLRRWSAGDEVMVLLCFAPVRGTVSLDLSRGESGRGCSIRPTRSWHGPGSLLPRPDPGRMPQSLRLSPQPSR